MFSFIALFVWAYYSRSNIETESENGLFPSFDPWYLDRMVAKTRLRAYDVKKFFSDSFDVTKCLQQIEMPDLILMCA